MNKPNNSTIGSLIKKIRSGVIHIEFLNEKNVIASGSGFLSSGYLITNSHIYMGPPNTTTIRLAWHPEASTQSTEEITIPIATFQSYLKTSSDENNHDYAILNVPELQEKGLYDFSLASHNANNIFDEILILGFPLEHHKSCLSQGSYIIFLFKKWYRYYST